MKAIDGNNLVKQHNDFVRRKPALTEDESKIFLGILSLISSTEEKETDTGKDIELEVDVREFSNFYGIDTRTAYTRVKEALLGLMKKPYLLEIEESGKKSFKAVALLKESGYVEGRGFAEVVIDGRLRHLLTNLTERYTRFELKYIVELSGNPTRLYEYFKSYERARYRNVRLSVLRAELGLEGKYKQNADFMKIVIEPAIREINRFTDLQIQHKDVKGRGAQARISFTIDSKNASPDDPRDIVQWMKIGLDTKDEVYLHLHKVAVEKTSCLLKDPTFYLHTYLCYMESKDSKISDVRAYCTNLLRKDPLKIFDITPVIKPAERYMSHIID